jgi:hypothetical protein
MRDAARIAGVLSVVTASGGCQLWRLLVKQLPVLAREP